MAATQPPIPASVQPILDGDLTGYQWMLDAVNAPEAWATSTGSGVTVAVIDSGVDSTRPDLQGRVVAGGVLQLAPDGSPVVVDAPLTVTDRDRLGHGTHVAGIIAASDDGTGTTGVAPGASIMPVQFPGRALGGMDALMFLDAVTSAVEFAVAHDADVINLSVGAIASHLAPTPANASYLAAVDRTCAAIEAAEQSGTVVAAAAGNDGLDLNFASAPGVCNGALSVSALAPDLRTAFFSSYDPTVRLTAPGWDVLSVASSFAPELRGGHVGMSGTSMSSPVVAGVAALVKAAHPSYSAAQVEQAMTSTAQDVATPGRDPQTGFGLVDAAAALGVSAADAQPTDFISALAVQAIKNVSFRSAIPEGVVSWSPPSVHRVTGYTVSVFDSSGVTQHDVDGLQVRLQLPMATDAWAQVTAHTTAGDVSSFPTWLLDLEGGGGGPDFRSPPKVRHPQAKRLSGELRVSWAPPETKRSLVDALDIVVRFDNGRYLSHRVVVRDSEPFPRQATVKLPHWTRSHDLQVAVVSLHRLGRMGFIPNVAVVPGALAAPLGMSIDRVDGAGPHAAEVSGGISAKNAQRVCGNDSCAGRRVVVRVRYGSSVGEIETRLTVRGVFHAMVWRPVGVDRLQLRVIGPGDLTSGPFHRYQVRH